MDQTNKALAGKRIGIFGKGGSGKSTVAVLLAKGLRAQGFTSASQAVDAAGRPPCDES